MHISKEKYFPIDTVLNVVPGETVRPTFHMISTLKPRVPMNTLIMAQVGYNPNQTTAGAMIGFGKKKNGFYIGFRSDFGSAKGDLVCDENGIIEGETEAPFYKTGRKKAIAYVRHRNELVLAPFQGPIACTRIRFGRGVCGTAWKEAQTLIVPDVEQFPGHIACSSDSKSEIVVPIIKEGNVIGVLDIDSDTPDSFDETDARYLEEICTYIG